MSQATAQQPFGECREDQPGCAASLIPLPLAAEGLTEKDPY